MKTKERRTLVTNEDQIQVGKLVAEACPCGQEHRFLVTSRKVVGDVWAFDPVTKNAQGVHRNAVAYSGVPAPHGMPTFVLAPSVAARAVFIVETGQQDEDNPYLAAPKPATVDEVVRGWMRIVRGTP